MNRAIDENKNLEKNDFENIKNLCFNSSHLWKEIEECLEKLCLYLKNSKISSDIRELLTKKEFQNEEKILLNIEALIQEFLVEMEAEDLNIFFIEFFRVSSIYRYCVDYKIKAYEVIDNYINIITNHLNSNDKTRIDINLVIEKDILMINKAQFLFWDEKYDNSKLILDDLIFQFHNETDQHYIIKMTNFISCGLTYLAWINYIKNNMDEAEKCFVLSIKTISTLKTFYGEDYNLPNFLQISKRKLKIYGKFILIYRSIFKFLIYFWT